MNEAQTNAALKAVSQSIISLRKRLAVPGMVDHIKDGLQAELDVLLEVRDILEGGT